MRVLFSTEKGRIYCLVHAEKLTYLIAEKAMDLLKYLSQGIQSIYELYNHVTMLQHDVMGMTIY